MKKLSVFTTIFLSVTLFAAFLVNQSVKAESLSVSITSPQDGQVVPYNDTVIGAEVLETSPSATVNYVEFYVDDQLLSTDYDYPYGSTWYMMSQMPGSYYSLKAVAYDSESNVAISAPVNVQVQPDNIAPIGVITMPLNYSIVPANSLVLIKARAMDNYLVRNVVFFVNGEKICNDFEDNPPEYYDCLWETPKKKNVIYTIATRIYDYFGNFYDYSISVRSR
ncbi:Ig-like domain-containing protein [Candidatus Microgenomates bacterium]|nr:Ig-like domain-containing protein [Candidatus Microgenomates bacterium]